MKQDAKIHLQSLLKCPLIKMMMLIADVVDDEEDENYDVATVQGPCRCYLRSHVALPFEVPGTNILGNLIRVLVFLPHQPK